jgi:hypothetical protein
VNDGVRASADRPEVGVEVASVAAESAAETPINQNERYSSVNPNTNRIKPR